MGRPCVFLRFAGCNLKCPWCDTDVKKRFSASLEDILAELKQYKSKSVILTGGEPTLVTEMPELVAALKAAGYWIGVETNGTNGVDVAPWLSFVDYIACSPKAEFADLYGISHPLTDASHPLTGPSTTLTGPRKTFADPSKTLTDPSKTLTDPSKALIDPSKTLKDANEVRVVASSEKIVDFCRAIRKKIAATDYYISPCDRDGQVDFATAKAVLSQLDGWALSVQLHKLLGFR